MSWPPDHSERQQTLDTSQSFIVKAPAGSGKTTLLVERILRLLSLVEAPEQVVAITFTRKATAEMRNRVAKRLERAEADKDETALAVLKRNQELGWKLLQRPSRLNIITIDGLASFIARALPLSSSEEGLAQTIGDNTRIWYLRAAERALDGALQDENDRVVAETLLSMLHHQQWKLTDLLADMLERRAIWQGLLLSVEEKAFSGVVIQNWRQLSEDWRQCLYEKIAGLSVNGGSMARYLPGLAAFMYPHLIDKYGESNELATTIAPLLETEELTAQSNTAIWSALALILLTKDGTWRKSVTIQQGFPPAYKAEKAQLYEAIELLSDAFDAEDVTRLRNLPPAEFSELETERLLALRRLLVRALAELKVLFAEYGVSDFDAITQAATVALGEDGQPSELALSLDYRIQHILIDEFQDTSVSQIALIERLVAGWQRGDGRTVFIVGDPMQSVYRFRGADVGNFADVWHRKVLRDIDIKPLSIHANFRSRPELVEWVNGAFSAIFALEPADNAPFEAAVSAKVFDDNAVNGQLTYQACASIDEESQHIVNHIRTLRAQRSNLRIALLGNSRSAIHPSVKALKAASIGVTGVKLESLWDQNVVRELWILARAIHDSSDRVAWAALLRAPWCALALHELQALLMATPVFSAPLCAQLAGQRLDNPRLQYTMRVMVNCLSMRMSAYLDEIVHVAWQRLSGTENTVNSAELGFVAAFLNELRRVMDAPIVDFDGLEERLSKTHIDTVSSEANAVIASTIHQAKGLEYDVVILPSLSKLPASDKNKLLAVGQRNELGQRSLLFCERPDPEMGSQQRAAVLRQFEERLETQERYRRLYVAITRAQYAVHISWICSPNQQTSYRPPSKSLLSPLFNTNIVDSNGNTIAEVSEQVQVQAPLEQSIRPDLYSSIKRLQLSDSVLVDAVSRSPSITQGAGYSSLDWQRERNTFFGTAMHGWLEAIATTGFEAWWSLTEGEQYQRAAPILTRDGVIHYYEQVCCALSAKICASEHAAWILAQYESAACEWQLQSQEDGSFSKYIIDRTFVKDDRRYIIDYKAGADFELPKEEYRQQLERYGALMRAMENRPIMLALYYPLHDKLWQWNYSDS